MTRGVQSRIVRDTYCDSLKLLVATGVMSAFEGVSWAGAVMGTGAGLSQLADAGVALTDGVGANDLVLAVVGEDTVVASALQAGAEAALAAGRDEPRGEAEAHPARTISEAVALLDTANVAVVSVPGAYAALEAHHALSNGLHVLLFSDNVPVAEECELKERAADLRLLVMGPGAGTAVVSGTGLGFANALLRGPVGVVAAAGTGAQEVSSLLSRWGVGVSHVIGVGGRDLSAEIGGSMTVAAMRALEADPDTRAILIVSKPPDPRVAKRVLATVGSTPTVATFLGLAASSTAPDGVHVTRTLEEGALAASRLVADVAVRDVSAVLRDRVAAAIADLPAERRTVRGYFSGGTLCYEAQLILGELAGDVYSNEPLRPDRHLPAPPGSHVMLDLGAEEHTVGRPHPMIDPRARIDLLLGEARDPDVAVVLLDVVLGYGAHDDPAGELAGVCAAIRADGGPIVVAYVLGTDLDPQGYAEQRARLEHAGCLVPETAARAAYAAAAVALRQPDLAAR